MTIVVAVAAGARKHKRVRVGLSFYFRRGLAPAVDHHHLMELGLWRVGVPGVVTVVVRRMWMVPRTAWRRRRRRLRHETLVPRRPRQPHATAAAAESSTTVPAVGILAIGSGVGKGGQRRTGGCGCGLRRARRDRGNRLCA
jgi:hypothetical protein